MRIYEGSPRQDFEEVFRSIGAFLDQRGMKDVLLARGARRVHRPGPRDRPAAAGHVVGVDRHAGQGDADLPRRRHRPVHGGGRRAARQRGQRRRRQAGYYETAFRVLGRYMDEQKPRDVFFFEQDGAFVVRLLMSGQAGSRHELAEFTRDDIARAGRARPEPSPR